MNFESKVAIVTGASRGIGREIAKQFALAGAKVVITGRHNASLQQAAKDLKDETTGEILPITTDVAVVDDTIRLAKETIAAFGQIDILVNNAGITRDNILLRLSEDDWDNVLDTNLKGAFNCIKACTRPMMKKRSGVIINISSVIGLIGNAGQVNYAASKAGLIGMTKSVAKELASRNIRANAVAPGFIQTAMTAELPENSREELLAAIPLKRLGEAKEIADLVLFLSSDNAQYITGQVINVDGGMVI